jgi:hypothetical protein
MTGRKRTARLQNAAVERHAATAEDATSHSPGLILSMEKVNPLRHRIAPTSRTQKANLNRSRALVAVPVFANSIWSVLA